MAYNRRGKKSERTFSFLFFRKREIRNFNVVLFFLFEREERERERDCGETISHAFGKGGIADEKRRSTIRRRATWHCAPPVWINRKRRNVVTWCPGISSPLHESRTQKTPGSRSFTRGLIIRRGEGGFAP